MKKLLESIKGAINDADALASLVGRVFLGIAGAKTKLSDGPYARVSPVTSVASTGFGDAGGDHDVTPVQISVFGPSLVGADALADELVNEFHGRALDLQGGGRATGRRVSRGVLVEPAKTSDSTPVFQSYVTFEFVSDA